MNGKRITEHAVTVERVRQVLHYDRKTGLLFWRINISRKCRAGTVAGRIKTDGYVYIQIDGERHGAHIWAWVIEKGEFPVSDIDHENLHRSDNRWDNLREASRSQNNANGPIPKNNKSGFKGVSWDTRAQKWRAYVWSGNRQTNLGYFDALEKAVESRKSAHDRLYGDFARHHA